MHPRNKSYIIAREKRRIESDKHYLFCSNYIPESYLETLDEEERRLSPEELMDTFRKLTKKIGLDTEKGESGLCLQPLSKPLQAARNLEGAVRYA